MNLKSLAKTAARTYARSRSGGSDPKPGNRPAPGKSSKEQMAMKGVKRVLRRL